MKLEFKLPELGENIVSGTVTKVLIAVGDSVAVDQPIIELETDKAVVEIPSTISGTVTEIQAQVGKSINVGEVVFAVTTEPVSGTEAPTLKRELQTAERPKPATPPAGGPKPAAPKPAAPPSQPLLAAPSVRRLARQLGVDIEQVSGTGMSGRVSAENVKAFAARGATEPAIASAPEQPLPPARPVDQDRWGAVERQPMSAIRRKTAVHMTTAWQTIPHVTHFDSADITSVEAFRKQYAKQVEEAGGRLTVTVILLKVLASALRKFPRFNASVDMENQEVLFKKYIHIGVAVDTPHGLLVPVVRDVDRKSIVEMAVEVPQLAEKARARKLTLDEMQGGTFTLTNLGGLGGVGFTPIINAPEVAVLGISRARFEPVFVNGGFAPRLMLPLCVSYDHRVIDGADAARFLRWVAEALEQPFVLMLDEPKDDG